MKLPAVVNYIFNPKIVEECVELINDDSLPSTDESFPFAVAEFRAIRWNLQFATAACAYHLLETDKEKEALMGELSERIGKQEEEVRVGDFVNAKGELSKVKGPLGPGGWLLPITNRKVPLRIISATLINGKLQTMLELFSIAERRGLPLDWSDYKQIADEYAFYSLVSYWGREPNEQNDSIYIEGLSELIYTSLIGVTNLINSSMRTEFEC